MCHIVLLCKNCNNSLHKTYMMFRGLPNHSCTQDLRGRLVKRNFASGGVGVFLLPALDDNSTNCPPLHLLGEQLA